MQRIQNITFTVIAALIVFSIMGYNVAGALAPDIVAVPEASDLENRYYAKPSELSVDSLQDGTFQDSFEAFIADHVPNRDLIVLCNAALQRTSIATSAAIQGFEVYPTFFDSHYYVLPRDGLIVDRAEAQPPDAGGKELNAWIDTLNDAVQQHPDVRFVYDCVARHDQTEANPTYRYLNNRLNPAWLQESFIDRLDPRIDAFIDAVESYEEIEGEWFATDPHWTLERALASYNLVADRLGLTSYAYEDPVTVIDSWYGGYAKSGLDLDFPTDLKDLPIDFSSLSFYELKEDGGGAKQMGAREEVLFGDGTMESDDSSKYYAYFGGGSAEAVNDGANNGRTALFIGDSLSYCLSRFIASNYRHTVFLLPGNSRFDTSLESYLEAYDPDDVIVMMHATKYQSIAEYSPEFIGLEG